jgi:peptidylprolyl isomerase
VLASLALGCKRDDRPSADPDDRPRKPATSATSFAIVEDPMITAAPDGGKIPAPSDVAAPPSDAIASETGLVSKVLRKGTGTTHPTADDTVVTHYTGWTIDGKMFDSSITRGEPITLPLHAVIKGWTEGLQLMVEGEQRRFWIPGKLAYGDTPAAGRPTGTLVFDVELIAIRTPPPMPTGVAHPSPGF